MIKTNLFSSNGKYFFSSNLINYLELVQQPYTFNEIFSVLYNKIFKCNYIKNISTEERNLFITYCNDDFIIYENIVNYIKHYLVIGYYNESNDILNYYNYNQNPINISSISFNNIIKKN